MVVRFLDIGNMVDNHCLSFLFIMVFPEWRSSIYDDHGFSSF